MKRTHKILLIVGFCFVFVLFLYGSGVYYFWNRFLPNSWFGDTYITGMTKEEICNILEVSKPADVTVNAGETVEKLSLEDCEFVKSYAEQIDQNIKSQNPFLWLFSIAKKKDYICLPKITVNKKVLYDKWMESKVVQQNSVEAKASLYQNEDGCFVFDAGSRKRIDADESFDAIYQALLQETFTVCLDQSFFYEERFSEEELRMAALQKEVLAFTDRNIVLDMGDENITFDQNSLQRYIKLADGLPVKEDEALVLDLDAIAVYLRAALEPYNTVDTMLHFTSTQGREVQVPYRTYGTQIDVEDLVLRTMEVLQDTSVTNLSLQPKYIKEGYHKGLNDIGQTYVEVDMTNQMLYFYKDGVIALETPVVTGSVKRRLETPEGVNYIYFMQHNRVLHGGEVPTFVYDWMAVYKGVGLHDAKWRKEFGDDIYKTNGSHGCINMPLEKANALYDMVEVGIPVVTFY